MSESSETESQCDQILEALEKGRTLTTIIARDLCGCERLAARIKDLRNRGFPILTTIKRRKKKKWAEYTLEA